MRIVILLSFFSVLTKVEAYQFAEEKDEVFEGPCNRLNPITEMWLYMPERWIQDPTTGEDLKYYDAVKFICLDLTVRNFGDVPLSERGFEPSGDPLIRRRRKKFKCPIGKFFRAIEMLKRLDPKAKRQKNECPPKEVLTGLNGACTGEPVENMGGYNIGGEVCHKEVAEENEGLLEGSVTVKQFRVTAGGPEKTAIVAVDLRSVPLQKAHLDEDVTEEKSCPPLFKIASITLIRALEYQSDYNQITFTCSDGTSFVILPFGTGGTIMTPIDGYGPLERYGLLKFKDTVEKPKPNECPRGLPLSGMRGWFPHGQMKQARAGGSVCHESDICPREEGYRKVKVTLKKYQFKPTDELTTIIFGTELFCGEEEC